MAASINFKFVYLSLYTMVAVKFQRLYLCFRVQLCNKNSGNGVRQTGYRKSKIVASKRQIRISDATVCFCMFLVGYTQTPEP